MNQAYRILSINPGSTSTKIAVFDNDQLVFERVLRHSSEEIGQFNSICKQFSFRKNVGVSGGIRTHTPLSHQRWSQQHCRGY